MITYDILLFYGSSGLLIWAACFKISGQLLKALSISLLIIFVNAEFWEIPIFLMGYLRVPGYGFPHALNHLIVGFMAALLILISNFKLTKMSFFILCGNLAFNFLFLLFFRRVISSWILRSISLISLSSIFLWSVKKNG